MKKKDKDGRYKLFNLIFNFFLNLKRLYMVMIFIIMNKKRRKKITF